jgi:hypothetical protein
MRRTASRSLQGGWIAASPQAPSRSKWPLSSPRRCKCCTVERGSLHFVVVNGGHVRDTWGHTMIPNAIRWPAIAALACVACATDVAARDYGQYSNVDPAIRKWIEGLKDKTGQGCCATADGHPAEYEWDIAGNHYKVRIEGEWHDVPAEAVIDEPNRLGYATVWYWWTFDLDGQKAYHIRCFLPGSGG